MSVKWIEYNGKRILLCDHRGLQPEELIESINMEVKMVEEAPKKVLILDDFEGSVVNTAVMEHLKKMGPKVESRTERAAIVGVHGIRHILVSAYNRVTGAGQNQKLCQTQEEALEWLVS